MTTTIPGGATSLNREQSREASRGRRLELELEFKRLWNEQHRNAAIALILHEWREPLRRLAVRRGAHDADTEEFALTAIHRLSMRYDEERYENIYAVLCTTVSRLVWNRRRDARRRPTSSMDQDPTLLAVTVEEHSDPEREFASREEQLRLRRAVEDLSKPHREVIQLHYLSEDALNVQDTATTMGKPTKWVERAITSSRAELRARLLPVVKRPSPNQRRPA